MQKPLAVANELISIAKAEGNSPTQMKLQKLLFFAHGWYLALKDEPLLSEDIQAWPYGPVIPSVYHELKIYGRNTITSLATEVVQNQSGLTLEPPRVNDPTGYTQSFLRKIWDAFGSYSGLELSKMTHMEGTPWSNARGNNSESSTQRDVVIPNESIKDYFKKIAITS
ncbi:Panacea domain-containing protein [Desulfovibrio inopinatus]|uniref:Panacea domain-containing protein n=1 Tax=Desulfovibrio inopinatus TaxID=102109 RepID=UPI00041C9298|nr:type II toxin-antitoxin system antitoxin SocA domain-containing protein [Desulfovibrio inopinatus]